MTSTVFTDLQKRSKGFVSGLRAQESGIDGALLVTGSYHVDAYKDALFSSLGIACPDRIMRAVAKRKADYLAGRSIAQAAMMALDAPPAPITTAPSRAPVWPQGLTGSISHARGRCACMLSRNTDQFYGVDTEAIASGASLTAIRSETLTAQDRTAITKGDLPPAIKATLVFSAKEALFKALHPRVDRYFGFDCAELVAAPTQNMMRLRLTTDLAIGIRTGDTFPIRFEYTDTHVLTWLAVPSA
ncbi:4'-phosphopantetheinyl transferase [Marivita sp. S0852]|uniref:4'-phosphopantetheinyl transferase family protein n=1 Tax=Marivita sp. S0852 TaxID=3373893 RepID=UPI0039819B77